MPRIFVRLSNLIVSIAGFVLSFWIASTYFSMSLVSSMPPKLYSKLAFTHSELSLYVDKCVPLSIYIALGLFFGSVLHSIGTTIISNCHQSMSKRLYQFCGTAIYSIIGLTVFTASCVPYCRGLSRGLPKVVADAGALEAHDLLGKMGYPVVNSYGLFRRMTGVGGRPEIIIEGSNSPNGPWVPYEFMYKPGNLETPPPVVAPHQPRLDWQMWFAALGSVEYNPWFVSLCERILSGEKAVLELIRVPTQFQDKPPSYIRANLYHYRYTSDFKSYVFLNGFDKCTCVYFSSENNGGRGIFKMNIYHLFREIS